MRKVLEYQGNHVYDDLLAEKDFNRFFHAIQRQVSYRPLASHEYNPVWEPTDGFLMRGPEFVANLDDLPGGDLEIILGPIFEAVREAGIQNASSIVLIPYCWPPGSSIKWHTDQHAVAAISYYLHRDWNCEWGGEFMHLNIDETPRDPTAFRSFVDNKEISESIVDNGIGMWVAPKPNRLVLNESGYFHKVARIAPNAGNRFSIQGFLRSELAGQ